MPGTASGTWDAVLLGVAGRKVGGMTVQLKCTRCDRPGVIYIETGRGGRHLVCNGCYDAWLAERYPEQFGTAAAEGKPASQVTTGGLVGVGDVDREPVRWLWPGRIPLGKVSVLDGDPGTGKSTLTLTMAAKVSTGSPFPDGTRPERGDVILLNAEDDIGDTIRPRLEAAGADLARCWVLPDVRPEGKEPRLPELPADLFLLEDLVKQKAAALVVIATLSGLIPARQATRVDPLVALRSE